MATFIVSDGSVNRFGFPVVTEGIQLDAFIKNPVMLYMHLRDGDFFSTAPENVPIGRWENLRIENGNLLADAVFDEGDDFAMEIKRKVDDGFLNAASIGIEILAISEDADDMLPGQTRPTVLKSELLEISIVDIPANSNAIKLMNKGQTVKLSSGFDINQLNNILPEMEDKKTISQQITEGVQAAFSGFMENLKANFTLTAKEDAEKDMAQLAADMTASIGAIELSVETPEADNTAMETLTALKSSNEEMAEELVQLKGAGSQKKPATENKSLANNKETATEEESAELQSLGLAFKKHYNRQ